jgi:hypothetical protein
MAYFFFAGALGFETFFGGGPSIAASKSLVLFFIR